MSMLKILLHIIMIFFFNFSVLYAEIIEKINIKGNKRISKETILVLGNIKTGILYENSDLNIILKNLYDTKFFSDIDLNIKDDTLNILLKENPIIDSIEIVNIKKQSLIDEILEAISLKERMSFTKNELDDNLILVNNLLKSKGYYFSKVNPSIIENNTLNSLQLFLDIELGNKAKIKNIKFIGDKKIKDKRLLEVLASEEHKFWKFVSNRVYLNRSLLDLDRRLLTNFYKNQGYYNVKVESSFVEFNSDGYFDITFNINSGKKFYFNDFEILLPEDYDVSDFKLINDKFDELKGETYSLNDFNFILKEIETLASNKLYEFIDAKVETTFVDENKINLKFNVVSAEKHYVEKIDIFGNYTTIEEVVRNRFIVDEGDPLNPLLFSKSLDNIRSLGIFKKVDYKISDGRAPNTKKIELIVEEQPTGEINLGAGYGTNGGTLAAGIIEKNFLGKGINLNTNIEISEEKIKGQFIYSKPNFAYTDNTLFTSFTSSTDDFLTSFGYKASKIGFSIGTKFEQYKDLFFSPEIDVSFEDLETNSSASSSLSKQKGNYNDVYFNYGLIYDKRNSFYKPTSGYRTSFRQDLPMISDSAEITNTLNYTKYTILNQNSNMVGKANFLFQTVNSLKGSDVRISKRAQVPYSKLRGFERGGIGPVDNNLDHIGGNYVSAVNLSSSLPQIFTTVENVDFSYFVDIANVWGVDFDDNINNSNYIRTSTGIGLDLLTPIGPLSFSIAQPITKKSSDLTEKFRFNLGTTF